ncbi:hypothetical protein MCESLAEM7_00335 [Candidatus Pelagibacterales bacterium]
MEKDLNSLSFKAGKLTRKYWYVLAIIFIIYIFYPTDHMDNCVSHAISKNGWREKYAVENCASYKRLNPEEFKYWKGLVFQQR